MRGSGRSLVSFFPASRDQSLAALPAPPSSGRPGAAPHRGRLAGPSSEWPGPTVRTVTPIPRASALVDQLDDALPKRRRVRPMTLRHRGLSFRPQPWGVHETGSTPSRPLPRLRAAKSLKVHPGLEWVAPRYSDRPSACPGGRAAGWRMRRSEAAPALAGAGKASGGDVDQTVVAQRGSRPQMTLQQEGSGDRGTLKGPTRCGGTHSKPGRASLNLAWTQRQAVLP